MDLEKHDGPIPEQIAGYKIEGLFTKGGMNCLYLGTHPESSEPVLIKVLLPKFLKDPDISARFINEANVIAKANHPNIVRLYDSGTWEGGLYIAMEFVKGTSLRKILAHQPFSLKRALEILLQIAYALCHLHTHGVVHGDVKPENILITEAGQVKLIDFGIAQVVTEKEKLQIPKRLVGTPIYMSPEQLEDWGNVSCQSDIYSLGIIAYELALGKITHGRVILSLAPRGLQKILHKALQPKIEDRYADMVDFIADLSMYIKSGSYEKDKQGSDYFLELFETLEQFQETIVPAELPQSTTLELGLVARSEMGLPAQYYDIVKPSQEEQVIFIAENRVKAVIGTLAIAGIRTLFQTLVSIYKEPKLLCQNIQIHIEKDPFLKNMLFCLLWIDTKAKTFSLFHNGYGLLLQGATHIQSLPIEPSLFFAKGAIDNRVILAGSISSSTELLTALKEACEQTASQPCQQQAEAIVRRIYLKEATQVETEPLLIAVAQIP